MSNEALLQRIEFLLSHPSAARPVDFREYLIVAAAEIRRLNEQLAAQERAYLALVDKRHDVLVEMDNELRQLKKQHSDLLLKVNTLIQAGDNLDIIDE